MPHCIRNLVPLEYLQDFNPPQSLKQSKENIISTLETHNTIPQQVEVWELFFLFFFF